MNARILVLVHAYWPDGHRQELELDHWPNREELPPDAVRFDIAWPDSQLAGRTRDEFPA